MNSRMTTSGVVFRFCRPSGSVRREPSREMKEALRKLSESAEMEPLLAKARSTGKVVMIEVFHTKHGQPLLIHTALLPKREVEKEKA